MQAVGHIRRRFLQAALTEISAGRAATCGTLMQAQAHSSAAHSSPETDEKHLQRFFKTANVAEEPEVPVQRPRDVRDPMLHGTDDIS